VHLFPTVIAKAFSKYSGDIKVVEGLGFRHLSTDSIQHSGGIVTEIWSTALRPYAQKHKSWLILGVAGGSVIKLISRKYHPSRIVGVDIDPVIVDLGKKYFGLDKIPNLKIIIGNANNLPADTYDFILVDLFDSTSCPDFVYTSKFLNKTFKSGQTIFINHLYNSPKSRSSFHKLKDLIIKIKSPPQIRYILQNAVFIIKNIY